MRMAKEWRLWAANEVRLNARSDSNDSVCGEQVEKAQR